MKKGIFFKRYGQKTGVGFGVFFVVIFFALVAFHNLGKFETSDEDLWKDTRIKRYFNGWSAGLRTGDFQKTYVNDKPGVTVSILSGMALPFIADPGNQDVSKSTDGVYLYQKYRTYNTESVNRGLRIPIVLFTAGMLILIGFLLYRFTHSLLVTVAGSALVALNPVLLGMSQIINPDAVLWSSVTVAILLYAVSLRNGSWKWAVWAGLFFGWAIASKYTGNLLSVFFLGLLLLSLVFEDKTDEGFAGRYRKKLAQFFTVTVAGYAVFVALVPFVLTNFSLFSYGTFLSPGTKPIAIPMAVVFALLVADAYAFSGKGISFLATRMRAAKPWLLRFFAGALLLVFLGHWANAWTGARFVPLNDLRETIESQTGTKSAATITLVFPMIDANDASIEVWTKKVLVQSAYIFFTTPTITVGILMFGMLALLIRGKTKRFGFVVFALAVPWVFVLGGLMADVLVNVRYGILVQPIFGILAGLFVWEGIGAMRRGHARNVFAVATLGGIFVFQVWALWSVRPYFLNYQNDFLPKEMSFADSWSYGSYEAAMWLNALPDAKYLTVWADRKAVCRFFVGKCVRGSSIDRSKLVPDYFVITRRNVVKHAYFSWKNSELAIHSPKWYYDEARLNHPAWELYIGGRPLNFVKIISSEESLKSQNGE